ncbi:hypothetical protein AVEN_271887-1 [Araneus ventricosus]|uniref:Uncharacterized protein n=1 Tax=Araneus ventricosus TaxID=182803 RepID=A0A4Y2PNL6_ARAVE|nr:hypothetical protein AVEN_271887-1 [Araneus ventricosus]
MSQVFAWKYLVGRPPFKNSAVKLDIHGETTPSHLERTAPKPVVNSNRIGAVGKFGFSSTFVFHLARWVIKLKYDPKEGERGSLTKEKNHKM